jgi:hypothetical protein
MIRSLATGGTSVPRTRPTSVGPTELDGEGREASKLATSVRPVVPPPPSPPKPAPISDIAACTTSTVLAQL